MEEFRHNSEITHSTSEKSGDDLHKSDARIGAMALKTGVWNNDEAESIAKVEAESFLRRHGRELALFSKDSKLTFVPSTSADTFAFHPDKFKVEVPLDWFASEKYNENELSFANHHEIAHFIDMRKNPKAYLDNFEKMRQRAERLTKDYLAKHPGEANEDSVRDFYRKEIHGLYNVLDDIYVNNLVFQRNKFFDSGDGRKSVESLYEKLGFENADLTDRPLNEQMIYSVLRDEMIGKTHGKSIVDERVESVLKKKKKLAETLGENIQEIIDRDLKPRQGTLKDPAERYQIIRALVEPEYLKLLEVALEEQANKNRQEQEHSGNDGKNDESNRNEEGSQGEGGEKNQDSDRTGGGQNEENREDKHDKANGQPEVGNNGNEFNPFGDKRNNASDILSHGENGDQVIEEILKSLEEAKRVDEMSQKERKKYLTEKRIQEFDEKHDIKKEERAECERVKKQIDGALKKMREFWPRLIGKSIEYQQTILHRQRRGRLNVGSYVQDYAEVVESERRGDLRKLEIYDRNGLERRIVDQPERIDVTLLVDCSGSMRSGTKVEVAKQTAALLMYSIKDFNRELKSTQKETHSKLRANTEVIVFGDSFESVKTFKGTSSRNDNKKVKKFEREDPSGDNDAEIIKSISEINSERGSTDDASPLESIFAGLTSNERRKIEQGKLKKIVFEITDGVSNDPSSTAERLAALAKSGVIVVGFQIGDVGRQEKETFQDIWNDGQRNDNKKGIFIGNKINELPDRLMSELKRLLNNIRM